MTKTIDTLVQDIYDIVDQPKDITKENIDAFVSGLGNILASRLGPDSEYTPALRLSNLGTPCERKLWYTINKPEAAEPLPPAAKLKFLFGDILEELLLFLATQAGHTVEGKQDELNVHGVVGHRDAVIDGRLVDVKSASTYGYKKFKENGLRGDDPFGYITQLGTYLRGSQTDGLVKEKDVASFLVIDKTLGNVCLDTYAFDPEEDFKSLVESKREMLAKDTPPARAYSDVPEGKSGNMKLDTACSYCNFKETCWPSLKTYAYARGPVFLTKVVREPRVENF